MTNKPTTAAAYLAAHPTTYAPLYTGDPLIGLFALVAEVVARARDANVDLEALIAEARDDLASTTGHGAGRA